MTQDHLIMNHMTHRMLSKRQWIQNLHSNKNGEHATETLGMIHLDICGPMSCIQQEDFPTS